MGVAASLEPKILAGVDKVDVVLVLVLPPAAVGVKVCLGPARSVDHDLQPGNVERGQQVASPRLRFRALITSLAEMGRPHDAVKTSSPGRGPSKRTRFAISNTGHSYADVGPVSGENAPEVHAVEPRYEGAHAGVGPLEEVRPGRVHLDAIQAHVLPAAMIVVAAAAEPQVLGLAGLACNADDHAAVDRLDCGAERRLQRGATARASPDGGGDLGRVAYGH